ncbi:MAG: hypothetical protein ACPK7O_05360 [Methanobacterium sp.]
MINLLFALVITIILEFLILCLFFRKSFLKIFIYSVLINSFTLPVATYLYYFLLNNIFIVEGGVILAESVLIMFLMEIKYKKAIFISIVANIITAAIGFLI